MSFRWAFVRSFQAGSVAACMQSRFAERLCASLGMSSAGSSRRHEADRTWKYLVGMLSPLGREQGGNGEADEIARQRAREVGECAPDVLVDRASRRRSGRAKLGNAELQIAFGSLVQLIGG